MVLFPALRSEAHPRVRDNVSHTKVNISLVIPHICGIFSLENQWILITIVNKFLKVFFEVWPVMSTIVGIY